MANKPILFFPEFIKTDRSKKNSTPLNLITPTKDEQIESFDQGFKNLKREFKNHTVRFRNSIAGLLPEMMLVFEIAGTIDEFYKAVQKTEGMEYLAEYPDDKFEETTGFFYRDKEGNIKEQPVERRVFVTLHTQAGINELLSHWNRFKAGEAYDKGTAKFRYLFNQLIGVRLYNLLDRLKDTGFENYLQDLQSDGIEMVKFEIEFTFHALERPDPASL